MNAEQIEQVKTELADELNQELPLRIMIFQDFAHGETLYKTGQILEVDRKTIEQFKHLKVNFDFY